MKKFKKHLVSVILLMLLLVSSTSVAFAQQKQEEKTKFGIGLQASLPVFVLGISGMLDITPNVSIQGILGPLGNLKMYAGKGIYRVIKTSAGNIYGYGMIGAWSYPLLSWNSKEGTETVMGFGAGIGLEVNLKALYPNLFSNLSPISCNAEIGLRSVKFKEASCYFPIPISIGAGIHYRF